MEKTNVLFLLTPKAKVACLSVEMNVRQALEKMRAHGYSAIPMINEEGQYVATVSEGDLLWQIVSNDRVDLEKLTEIPLKELKRKDDVPAVKVDEDISKLVEAITNHNFVPVVDDRNVLMGIVTRKSVIQTLLKNQ